MSKTTVIISSFGLGEKYTAENTDWVEIFIFGRNFMQISHLIVEVY